MKIEELYLDKLKSYCYIERYVNEGSISGFSKHTTSEGTRPLSHNEKYPLVILKFDESVKCTSYGKKMVDLIEENEMFIHPDMLEENSIKHHARHIIQKRFVDVSPTASGRTVKIYQVNGSYIKLTYRGILGRFKREFGEVHIKASLEVSNILFDLVSQKEMCEQFAFLPERYGKVVTLQDSEGNKVEWGYIIRDSKPYPDVSYEEVLIPMFSLFARNGEDDPFLVQLYRKQSKSAEKFIFYDIISPLCQVYWETLIGCGIAFEAHAQNMLLSIDHDFRIRRIVARDLESADCDLELMKMHKIPYQLTMRKGKCISKEDYNYQIKHSFMFDFKLGEYILTPLLKCAEDYLKINSQSVLSWIQEYNQNYIKQLPVDYFPVCWYDYDHIVFGDNEKRLYNIHNDVKYR